MFASMFADFVIKGEVVAAESQASVGYAEAFFIDTGLDTYRASQGWERRIGTADASGQLDQGFGYGWCEEFSFNSLGVDPPDLKDVTGEDRSSILHDALLDAREHSGPRRTFAIEVRKDGFEPYRLNLELGKLSEEESVHTLDLGKVVLELDSATASDE